MKMFKNRLAFVLLFVSTILHAIPTPTVTSAEEESTYSYTLARSGALDDRV
jgi:hypothetical protein